jgi:acylphosphatase
VIDMPYEVHLRITGSVQGVGYRSYIQDKAFALQINGFARNLSDGSVEVIAQGAKEDLRRLASYARLGSAYAQVEEVQVTWLESTMTYSGFSVR